MSTVLRKNAPRRDKSILVFMYEMKAFAFVIRPLYLNFLPTSIDKPAGLLSPNKTGPEVGLLSGAYSTSHVLIALSPHVRHGLTPLNR